MKKTTPGPAVVQVAPAILGRPAPSVMTKVTRASSMRIAGECGVQCRSRRRHGSNAGYCGVLAAQQYAIFSAVDPGKSSS